MSFLSELQEQAIVVSGILNTLNPTTMHFNPHNYTIFGNYNHEDFQVPEKHKKHFGNQSILTAIAKVNGYNTYKSLLDDTKPDLARNSMYKALELLNPYPLSEFNTQTWLTYIKAILESFHYTQPLKPHTYQNFKKHEEAPYLNFINCGFKYSYALNRFGSLISIAESIYLTALKQPLTRIVRDNYVSSGNSIIEQRLLEMHTEGFKTEPFLFQECLNQAIWDDRSIATIVKPLEEIFDKIFSATFSISGKTRNPLKKLVTVTFNDRYSAITSNKLLAVIQSQKEHLRILQQAAQELKKEIDVDNVVYTHPDFSTFPSVEFDHNLELNFELKNSLNQKKFNNNTYHQDQFIKGSKLYWINISPSLFPYPLVDQYRLSINLSDEIKQFIKTEVLNKLTPAPKIISIDDKYKYYFRVKQELTYLYEEPLNIPEYVTVFSKYSIPEEVALLMAHAEIYRLANADVKYYGQPNQVISFDSFSFDLEPENLSDPSKYEGLTKIKISRLKKPHTNSSYFIKFHPEAIIQNIQICSYDNESFPELNINDETWIRLTLIDCLIKKMLSHEEMGSSEILFKSTPLGLNDRTNIPYAETVRLKKANIKELNIEEYLINMPCMKEIINQFLQEAILKLSMKNDNDSDEIRLAPFQAISHPFSEHYVRNKPINSNHAMQIDVA